MTEAELAEIESRCQAAAPGPWRSMVEGRDHTSGDSFIMLGTERERGDDMYISVGPRPASAPDQDFIANARQDIPRLIEEIRRLRGRASD
jgi:hypothetical protein